MENHKKHLQFAIAFPIELIKANDRLLPAAIAALDTCENFCMNVIIIKHRQ